MRNFIAVSTLILTSSLTIFAQESNSNSAEIAFDIETINYGQIEKNANGSREFSFKNTGKEPLNKLCFQNNRGYVKSDSTTYRLI